MTVRSPTGSAVNSMELTRARVIIDQHEAMLEYGLKQRGCSFRLLVFADFQTIDASVSANT